MSNADAQQVDVPILQTDRLRLRGLQPADAGAIYAMFSDDAVSRYWAHPTMTTRDAAVDFIRRAQAGIDDGSLLEWGITLAEDADDAVIGTCALAGWDREHGFAEVGVAVRRDRWRRGYATEALRAVVDYGFDVLDLHRVEGDVDPRNTASRALLESLGFRREGHLRERYRSPDGTGRDDALLYGLLRDAWKS